MHVPCIECLETRFYPPSNASPATPTQFDAPNRVKSPKSKHAIGYHTGGTNRSRPGGIQGDFGRLPRRDHWFFPIVQSMHFPWTGETDSPVPPKIANTGQVVIQRSGTSNCAAGRLCPFRTGGNVSANGMLARNAQKAVNDIGKLFVGEMMTHTTEFQMTMSRKN